MCYAKTEQEFNEFYQTHLKKEQENVENLRLKMLKKLKKKHINTLLIIGVINAIAITYALITNENHVLPTTFLISVFLYLFLFGYKFLGAEGALTGEMKRLVVRQIAPFVHPNLSYHPRGYIKRSAFIESKLYPSNWVTNFEGEDLVTGRIGETEISFSELDVEHVYTKKRRREKY